MNTIWRTNSYFFKNFNYFLFYFLGHIIRLQARSRGFLIRREMAKKRWAVIKLQSHVRRIIAQREYRKMKVERRGMYFRIRIGSICCLQIFVRFAESKWKFSVPPINYRYRPIWKIPSVWADMNLEYHICIANYYIKTQQTIVLHYIFSRNLLILS